MRYPKPKNKLKSLKPSCILDMMIYTPNIFHTPLSNKQTNHLGSLSEKKTGLCEKNSQAADPPPTPPVWETPVIKKKKLGLFFILGPQEHVWSSPKNHHFG